MIVTHDPIAIEFADRSIQLDHGRVVPAQQASIRAGTNAPPHTAGAT